HLRDAVEIADPLPDGGEDVERGRLRRFMRLLLAHRAADLAVGDDAEPLRRRVAGGVEQPPGLDAANAVRAGIDEGLGQAVAHPGQLLLDRGHVSCSSLQFVAQTCGEASRPAPCLSTSRARAAAGYR